MKIIDFGKDGGSGKNLAKDRPERMKIRSMAEANHAEVWLGHDIPQFGSLRKATEG